MLVDHDAIVGPGASIFRELGIRNDADADHHKIGRQLGAVGKLDRLHRAVALDALDRHAKPQAHAVRAVQGADLRRNRGGQHAVENRRLALDYGDHEPALKRARGDLEADEAATDHDQVPARLELGRQPIALFDRAQVVDTRDAVGRTGERPHAAAGA